jgi:hypothetical protein
MMSLTNPAKWIDPIGQIRLVPFFRGKVEPFLEAFDALLSDSRLDNAQLAAEFAFYAARNAHAC